MSTPDIAISSTAGHLTPSVTLAITSRAKAMIADGQDVISLCAGEPDFDTPEVIKKACIDAINSGQTKYTPAAGMPSLRQALSEKFAADNYLNYDASQIVVSPGGKFSLMVTIQTVCNAGDEVIIPQPAWLSYPEMVKAVGATPVYVQTSADNNFCMTAEALEAAITDKTKLVILNSPSNPIGNMYSREELEAIAEVIVKHNLLLISDEIYEKLTYDEDLVHVSPASLNEEIYQRTITINGFSKAYSMTGWRLGYLGAPKWLAPAIAALQSHETSNPTTFAQHGALAALQKSGPEVDKMRAAFAKRRDLIFQLLSEIPQLSVIEPKGAFYIFPEITGLDFDALTFCEKLLSESKVAVIPGTPFGAPKHIRLSYACSEENIREAVSRIKAFCAKYAKA